MTRMVDIQEHKKNETRIQKKFECITLIQLVYFQYISFQYATESFVSKQRDCDLQLQTETADKY